MVNERLTGQQHEMQLHVSGMTCASCAAHVEQRLNQIEGVDASVNYATELATIYSPKKLDESLFIQAVAETGYSAEALAETGAQPSLEQTELDQQDALRSLRYRLLICSVLTVPVVAMAMVPVLQVTNWQWWSLALATPVVLWGAYPFHRATWINLRHRTATMDTLISIGTLSAYSWSVFELLSMGDSSMSDPVTMPVHMATSPMTAEYAAGEGCSRWTCDFQAISIRLADRPWARAMTARHRI